MNDVQASQAFYAIAHLVHAYTYAADHHDVTSGLALLQDARVRFPWGGFSSAAEDEEFLTRLWGRGEPQRHDVTNLLIEPAQAPGQWKARAHFTRWVFSPEPVLDTLGEYDITVAQDPWKVVELTVSRLWGRTDDPASDPRPAS